jgi:hypothetical protein
MERSERAALLATLSLAIAGCDAIAGLTGFHDVSCDDPPCDVAPDGGDDGDTGGGAIGDDDASDVWINPIAPDGPLEDAAGPPDVTDVGDASDASVDQVVPEASIDREWARWVMPNSAYSDAAPNPARYDTSVTGVVLDKITTLEWQNPTAAATSLAAAQSACVAPWRVPTRIELVSILDVSRSPVTANEAFSFIPQATLWTASTTPGGASWVVSFAVGDVTAPLTSSATAVICVQGGS